MQFKSKLTGIQKVERELNKLGKRTGRGSGDVCKEVGGWTAQNLARYVQPVGLGGKARQSMEAAIRRDIRRVAFPVKGGGLSRSELEQAHRGAKNSRGRVPRKASREKVPVSPAALASYTAEVQSRAGFAKAGWIKAAKALKGKATFQKWISRHDAPGFGRFKSSIWKPIATIANRVGYVADGRVLPNRAKTAALRGARRRMITSLKREVKKQATTTNRKI